MEKQNAKAKKASVGVRVDEPELVDEGCSAADVVSGDESGAGGSVASSFSGATNVDADGVQVSSELSDDGRYEYPDPVPVGVPLGYRASPSLRDTIERIMANHQLAVLADLEGFDSPEDAEDFEIEDDPLDPHTPYEAHFFPAQEPTDASKTPKASPDASAAEPSNGAPAPAGEAPASPASSFSPDQIKLFEAYAAWQSQNSVKRSEG